MKLPFCLSAMGKSMVLFKKYDTINRMCTGEIEDCNIMEEMLISYRAWKDSRAFSF